MSFERLEPGRFREILQKQNRWRHHDAELRDAVKDYTRPAFRILLSALQNTTGKHQIISGARQTGKSTLLRQIIAYLKERGIPDERVFYLQMDSQDLEGESLVSITDELLQMSEDATAEYPIYIFADELGSSENWRRSIKEIYDIKLPVRILASSSAAVDVLAKEDDPAPGRFIEHVLFPLDFMEYIEFTTGGQDIPKWCHAGYFSLKNRLADIPQSGISVDELAKKLDVYILTGGYPEDIASNISLHSDSARVQIGKRHRYLQNLADRVLVKDIAAQSEIRNPSAFSRLLYTSGNLIARHVLINEIGNNSQIDSDTTKKYLYQAERAKLLFLLNQYSTAPKGGKSGYRKMCYYDTGMAAALSKTEMDFWEDPDMKGWAYDNTVGAGLRELAEHTNSALDYWRKNEKWEVDYIFDSRKTDQIAVEVGSRRKSQSKSPGLPKFLEKYPEFQGSAYYVTSATHVVPANKTKTGIGELPITLFLLAVAAQSRQEALLKHGAQAANYRIVAPTPDLYPRAKNTTLDKNDFVFLLKSEAAEHADSDALELGKHEW